jgi:ubiquinone/menaquinone biosynthesis C-methylase UbiE
MKSKAKIWDKVYADGVYEKPAGIIPYLYDIFKAYEKNRYQVVTEFLPTEKERLLDIGCGGGHLIYHLEDLFREYYGVDISQHLLQHAEMKLSEVFEANTFSLRQYDIDDGLPFEDSFFDAVSCVAVLQCVNNPPNLIQEVNRVLKPGGIFIIQVPNIAFLPYRIQLLFGIMPVTGGSYLGADWECLHIFTKKLITQLLVGKGFNVDIISCSGIMANYRKYFITVLSGDLIVRATKS